MQIGSYGVAARPLGSVELARRCSLTTPRQIANPNPKNKRIAASNMIKNTISPGTKALPSITPRW
jgi:hypothetical protein